MDNGKENGNYYTIIGINRVYTEGSKRKAELGLD